MSISERFDFSNLSGAEKILLAEELLSSVCKDLMTDKNSEVYLSDEQKQEIDRRIKAYKNGQMQTYSWEDVKARLYQEMR